MVVEEDIVGGLIGSFWNIYLIEDIVCSIVVKFSILGRYLMSDIIRGLITENDRCGTTNQGTNMPSRCFGVGGDASKYHICLGAENDAWILHQVVSAIARSSKAIVDDFASSQHKHRKTTTQTPDRF